MSELSLTEKLLAGLAGWETIKQARAILAEDRVLSSNWQPPVLRGVVQSGGTSYRAGLVIHRENDAENLCTCRQSREWGTLCAHSVAVGLHHLRPASGTEAEEKGGAGKGGDGKGGAGRGGALGVGLGKREVKRLRRAEVGGVGEPLEVHVILPPNLEEGLGRGKATLFFEGQWRRGRGPLTGLPMDQGYRVGPEDERLLEVAERLAGGETPGMMQLGSVDFAELLGVLTEHPRVTRGRSRGVRVLGEAWRPRLQAVLEGNGEILLRLRSTGRAPVLVAGERWWVMEGDEFRPLALPKECQGVMSGALRFTRGQVPRFVSQLLPGLQEGAELDANFGTEDFVWTTEEPEFRLHLAGGLAVLWAQLQCVYGARVVTVGVATGAEDFWMPDPGDVRRYRTRHLPAEQAALERLTRHGFTGPDGQGRYQLSGQNQVLTFLAREYRRLEREWKVTLEERLERSTREQVERIEPRFSVTPSGEAWFDLSVRFQGGAGSVLPASEVQRLLRGGQSHTRLKNGKLALIDTGAVEELEALLVDCSPQQHAEGYRIGWEQAGFVQATLGAQGWQVQAPVGWRERALTQTGEVVRKCPDLGGLEGVLRPYQRQGVAWLGFLREHRMGGILADEMGLGKTLQTLAHLDAVRRGAGEGGERRPSLVVCPTSLVSNWVREAERFTPGLRVLALHGARRQAEFGRIGASDLVVTSYALIRRDLEVYRGVEFETVILDEAQHIKNRATQNAQAVKAVRSRHRLVLTGTPMENSVLDLWSLFDFLMPGYLGSAQEFRERYEMPIVREKDAAVQERLARRIRPFLLRRLKREVAPELPARIDQVVWCELSEEQASVYEQILSATRREILDAPGAGDQGRSRMLALTALLRLRQACCDLRLLGVDPAEAEEESVGAAREGEGESGDGESGGEEKAVAEAVASGKLEAFAELLEEVLDGGHRVLVFSQFTRVLGLIRERLESEGVGYAYLDGSTRDRGKVVAEFQERKDVPVFLISLKAGGVGLNLTGADTVIHFDPWWNPAVEDQATDRAHRIGQDRVVTSYKLITRGTVEEKILGLQQRKREVTRGLLTGEAALAESLTWEELRDLLS